MGVCLGWTLNQDIPQPAWENIVKEFQALPAIYSQELKRRAAEDKKRLPLFLSIFQSNPPEEPCKIKEASADAIEVSPGTSKGGPNSPDPDLLLSLWSWRLDRTEGEGWAKQFGRYDGEMLFAALLLVERHAPGLVLITQDDYEPGCWEQAATWVGAAVGAQLTPPARSPDLDEEQEDEAGLPPRASPSP